MIGIWNSSASKTAEITSLLKNHHIEKITILKTKILASSQCKRSTAAAIMIVSTGVCIVEQDYVLSHAEDLTKNDK